MRTKRSIFNAISLSILKIITILFGLLIPKLIIETYGSQIYGLIGSINNLYIYMSIFEAGIGTAAIQALYKPINNNNTGKINGILKATQKYYVKVGVLIIFFIILLAFIYPIIIEVDLDLFRIVFLIVIMGLNIVIDFFMQAKNRVLLIAEGKSYVLNSINVFVTILSNSVKLLLIIRGVDIITVQFSFFLVNLLKNLLIHFYIVIKYKDLKNIDSMPDFESLSNNRYTFIHNLSYVIFNNIDILLITLTLDLTVVSVYAIYKMIYKSIDILPDTLTNSLNSSFGQLYHLDKNRFRTIFNFFETYYIVIVFTFYIAAYILSIPFLYLYTKDFTDANYILPIFSLVFCFVSILNHMKTLSQRVTSYAGHFKETVFSSIVEIIVNVVLSVSLLFLLGLNGIVIATGIAIIYRIVFLTNYSSKVLLEKSSKQTYVLWARNLLIAILILFIFWKIDININNYFSFIVYGFFITIGIFFIYFIINSIFEKEAFKMLKYYYKVMTKQH